ncbi:MAG: purine-nucleoside phosphorylase [Planctomycetes bacterium]|nr:purine-nucleoside phosphorylase [Planctomycetota bacterium]
MEELRARIDEAAGIVKDKLGCKPKVGIILGTGLGNLARQIKDAKEMPYSDIPHFPQSTVTGHAGQFIAGKLGGQEVVVMEGRFHLYEGYSLAQVTFPVRVMKALGVETLIVTNACGGMNPQYEKGDIIIIEDHINFMGVNPLVGPNDNALGPRFPDMYCPYDPELLRLAETVALEKKIRTQRGVYLACTGPCLETRAEYRFMRAIGADAVGMSTVPEVIVAVHAGLKTLGMGVVTDICLPDALQPVNIEEIIAVANEAGPRLEAVILGVLEKM